MSIITEIGPFSNRGLRYDGLVVWHVMPHTLAALTMKSVKKATDDMVKVGMAPSIDLYPAASKVLDC